MVASLCNSFVKEVLKNMTEFLVVIVTGVHVHQIRRVAGHHKKYIFHLQNVKM
jgi:hypothetical protein